MFNIIDEAFVELGLDTWKDSFHEEDTVNEAISTAAGWILMGFKLQKVKSVPSLIEVKKEIKSYLSQKYGLTFQVKDQ